jgi:predicted nucleic acid-binding protein
VILYLDASALVKLYVEEAGSPAVAVEVERASAVVTARISYAEARAAFARLRREGRPSAVGLRRLLHGLDAGWPSLEVVEITDGLVRRAGALAEGHDLRAYDAIQLAAGLELRRAGVRPAFAAFDQKLNRAAHREGLQLAPR